MGTCADYFETDGGLPILRGQPLRPGEILISSALNYPVQVTTGGGQLVPLAESEITSTLPFRLIALNSNPVTQQRPTGSVLSTSPKNRSTASKPNW